MGAVFVSYSKSDRFFAELLEIKLRDAKIEVWRDASSLLAGEEWRQSIDRGVTDADLIVVVLSKASCSSQYVTYEWARGLAQNKSIVPVLLEECDRHPKLEPLQYVDFRNHNSATWEMLIQRISDAFSDENELSVDREPKATTPEVPLPPNEQKLINQIVGYMNSKGYRMISFDRIRKNFDKGKSDEDLTDLVTRCERFLPATLRGSRKGLALL